MIRIIIIIIAALFIGVLLFQIDDELDPGAALWLEKMNSPETSEAYFFLMGFFPKMVKILLRSVKAFISRLRRVRIDISMKRNCSTTLTIRKKIKLHCRRAIFIAQLGSQVA